MHWYYINNNTAYVDFVLVFCVKELVESRGQIVEFTRWSTFKQQVWSPLAFDNDEIIRQKLTWQLEEVWTRTSLSLNQKLSCYRRIVHFCHISGLDKCQKVEGWWQTFSAFRPAVCVILPTFCLSFIPISGMSEFVLWNESYNRKVRLKFKTYVVWLVTKDKSLWC